MKFENPFYKPPVVLISGGHENSTSASSSDSDGCHNAMNVWMEVHVIYEDCLVLFCPALSLAFILFYFLIFFLLFCFPFFLLLGLKISEHIASFRRWRAIIFISFSFSEAERSEKVPLHVVFKTLKLGS